MSLKKLKKWLGGKSEEGNGQKGKQGSDSIENDLATRNLIYTLIQDVPIMSTLKEDTKMELIRKLRPERFTKGNFIMNQGETGDKFYILVKGECDVVVKNHKSGVEDHVAKLKTGDYFGEQALLAKTERNASIQCLKDCQCLTLTAGHFMATVGEEYKHLFGNRSNKRAAVQDLEGLTLKALNPDAPEYKKSNLEKEWIISKIEGTNLFVGLTREQLEISVTYMYKHSVGYNQNLITQGDTGKTFYVVLSGSLDVFVEGMGKVQHLRKGDVTGELALMYNAPRAATVKAVEDSVCWALDRAIWRKALAERSGKEAQESLGFLKKIPIFSSLLASERELINQALVELTYQPGDNIIVEGAFGSDFFLMMSGEAKGVNPKDKQEVTFGRSAFFGERALLLDEPRAMTITAVTKCVCLSLAREDFDDLLGPLQALMERTMEDYNKPKETVDKVELIVGSDVAKATVVGTLGSGAFGVVSLVTLEGKPYALKGIHKGLVMENKQEAHVTAEKKLMAKMCSPFLVNLCGYYQDVNQVYLLLELCLGGELFGLLQHHRGFSEDWAKFYAACVIEGFHYMHSLDIIYRDLKPENLVLDSKGYIKITDFGFAKHVPDNKKTFTLCGTPDYLCPEIITGLGHGKGLDWWTLGVLVFEMVASHPPFEASEPTASYRKIMKVRYRCPKYFSMPLIDLVANFLVKKPVKRLGMNKGGAGQIRRHKWFRNFNWSALIDRSMKACYEPVLKHETDLYNFRDAAAQAVDNVAKYGSMDGKDTSWADKEFGAIVRPIPRK